MITGHWEIVAASAFAIVTLLARGAEKDADELSGSWAPVSANANGEQMPTKKDQMATFADGKSRSGPVTCSYRIDSAKEPKEVDYIYAIGDGTHTMQGIYKIEKDRLTICLSTDTPVEKRKGETISKRPTDFASGLGKLILVFDREKKAEEAQEKADGGREPQ